MVTDEPLFIRYVDHFSLSVFHSTWFQLLFTSRWLEACLKEELPATTELEESFTNGVTLAKLANFFAPKVVPLRKIYDKDLKRYEVCHA